MSRLEEQQCDPEGKNMSKFGIVEKNNKTFSLVDYVSDTTRTESLIGLRYVVEIKMLESDKSIVKCNLCNVEGYMATMKEHLVGTNHIKAYMEKHYFSVLQRFKQSTNKTQFSKLLKDYAKQIERAEGTQSVNVEYVSAAELKKDQENWLTEQQEDRKFQGDQTKFRVLDKRQMALNYSEKFKITSREEATIVLNLTQQLSNQLEQYFLKYKELEVLNSSIPDSSSTISRPAPINSSSVTYENLHPTGAASQGLKTTMPWCPEGPSSSMSSACLSTSVHSFDRVPQGDTRAEKRRADAPHPHDVLAECSSTSEFQSRIKRPHKECDDSPTVHSSSFSYMNVMGSPQHSSAEGSSCSSSIVATYTNFNNPKEKSYVPEMFGGETHMVRDTPQISQNNFSNSSKIEVAQGNESLKGICTADTSEVEPAKNTAIPGPSSSNSNCSSEASSERPSSSRTQGKTSKALSPDILHLLKGKDANTVTNILRTLSPFYPALQEVNIEILAQVLVNTGALD